MAPAMKLTLRWEEGKEESSHTMLKVTLPRAWKEGPTLNLKQLFVETHNKKHPDNQLVEAEVHLLNPKGEQLADDDVVIRVFSPSDTVRVKPGAPPSLEHAAELRKAATKKGAAAKTVVDATADGDHVNTAEALQKANETKFAFDYSKWDRLDLSDDDGEDCHPNIDLASWKRLRGRQRVDRREQEDKKIEKYQAKIDKYAKKVNSLKEKLAKDEGNIQLQVDLKDAETSVKEYETKLQTFLNTRKLVADDVCTVTESKGIVVQDEPESKSTDPSVKGKYPQSKQKEYDSYDSFQQDNRPLLKRFALMRDDLEREEFLLRNPALLTEHAEGFLLILTLDTCMKHQLRDRDPTIEKNQSQLEAERLKEYYCGKAHLTIHYISELGKSMNRNPLDGVKPFFRKTGPRSEDRVEGFEEDLTKFLERIRKRATEKISKGEVNPLVEEESSLVEAPEVLYEPAGLGPGGLDPNEVLQSLPENLQEAFVNQDTEKLREAFESLGEEEADYHLKRCIDSGLWIPNIADQDEEGEEMSEEEDNEDAVEEVVQETPAQAPEPVIGDVE